MDDEALPRDVAPADAISLAVRTVVVAFLAFVTVGLTLSLFNTAVGSLVNELVIFLGLPMALLLQRRQAPLEFVRAAPFSLRHLGYGFILGTANMWMTVFPLHFAAQHLLPTAWRPSVDASAMLHSLHGVELGVFVLSVSLAAPVCEEFMFRGVVQRSLGAVFSPQVAIAVAAVVFSAFHLDVVGFLARAELGLLFGVLFLRTQSLWTGVGAHLANNAVSVGLFFLAGDDEPPSPALVLAGLAAGGLVFAAAIAFLGPRVPPLARSTRSGPAPRATWVVAAACALPLLVAGATWWVDENGVRLNWHDAAHALPTTTDPTSFASDRDALERLRADARAGRVPLQSYFDARNKLRERLAPSTH